MMELLWLLLPVAAASGWWAAKREFAVRQHEFGDGAEYFRGLNYLLNDKPDEAIEVFTRMAKFDRDTVDTHIALGSLFRRRGEVDRAIRIHQELVARRSLNAHQCSRAMMELGEDYMSAGLFDRAEKLFCELAGQPEFAAAALDKLVDIYEQEKDWHQAIAYCDELQKSTGRSRKLEAANFCCELAEVAQQRGDPDTARNFLQQALTRDPGCVRASVLLGETDMESGDYESAIAAFKTVQQQDPRLFPEVIEPLGRCYAALQNESELMDYLRTVQERDHSGRVTVAVAESLARQRDDKAALEFLEAELRDYPTFLGLRHLIELKLAHIRGPNQADLETLYRISQHMLHGVARYQCDNCGFVGKWLHWQCPGCKTWNSIKPVPDLVFGQSDGERPKDTSPALRPNRCAGANRGD